MADLSEYSNTELKEKYGTANFTSLSEADSNFTFLVPYFGDLCRLLYEDGRLAEAEKAALFFVENGIYTYQIVTILGEIYSLINDTEKIAALIDRVSADPKTQERTITYLNGLMPKDSLQ